MKTTEQGKRKMWTACVCVRACVKDKRAITKCHRESKRSSKCVSERGEEAGCQRGHSSREEKKKVARSRHHANGPTAVNITVHTHTHTRTRTRTHGWPTALPAALSVTVWLVVLSSPSPANHSAICYPTTWPPTRQTHTDTCAKTQKHTARLVPGTAPPLSHWDTHIKLHGHRCSPKVSTR